MLLLLLALACGGDAADLDTPWVGASPNGTTVSGGFRARLGHPFPGAGWADVGERQLRGGAQAQVLEVEGTTWPVVQVRIFGATAGEMEVLELDIAQNHCILEEVPLNGTAAIGQLEPASGELRYVVGGTLILDQAGATNGEIIEGHFQDLQLGSPP